MKAKKRILFVCTENANRSQMAEAFARVLGGEAVEAASAGSRPAARLSARAIEAMREVGVDLSRHAPKSTSEIPAGEFDVVVTMGCGDACPVVPAKRREEWEIPDPRDLPPERFRAVRDSIREKVRDLLARI